jgi:hypothetical protein
VQLRSHLVAARLAVGQALEDDFARPEAGLGVVELSQVIPYEPVVFTLSAPRQRN